MARQRGAPDSFYDLAFPLGGIDVSTEFELQPAETAAAGVNVRAYEPGTQRARGGSRPGLAKYVPPQVNGAHLIQHLNYVVDPRGDALLTGADPALVEGGGIDLGILDPSTTSGGGGGGFLPGGTPVGIGGPFPGGVVVGGGGPGSLGTGRNPGDGRYVRDGGSGIAPNRNVGVRRPTNPPEDDTRAPARKVLMFQLQGSTDRVVRTGPELIDFWTTDKWQRCRAKNEVSPPLGAWKIVSYNYADGDFPIDDQPQIIPVTKVELHSGDQGIALPDNIQIYGYDTIHAGSIPGAGYQMGNVICLEVEGFPSGTYPTPLDTLDRFKAVCFFKSLLEAP